MDEDRKLRSVGPLSADDEVESDFTFASFFGTRAYICWLK